MPVRPRYVWIVYCRAVDMSLTRGAGPRAGELRQETRALDLQPPDRYPDVAMATSTSVYKVRMPKQWGGSNPLPYQVNTACLERLCVYGLKPQSHRRGRTPRTPSSRPTTPRAAAHTRRSMCFSPSTRCSSSTPRTSARRRPRRPTATSASGLPRAGASRRPRSGSRVLRSVCS